MKGFTLIETLLYIALLSLLMSGILFAFYQVVESTGQISKLATAVAEGDFVQRKYRWASGVYGNAVELEIVGGKIEMREDIFHSFVALTTQNVVATHLSSTTFTLNGEQFSL
jgi:type II secretory pathway pseudopilin PulG